MKEKKEKNIFKRILFVLSCIFVFCISLIPTLKCASYEEVNQLNYVNRVSGITIDEPNTSYRLYINNDNYHFTTRRYTIQMFEKNSLQTPVNIFSLNYITSINTDSGNSLTAYTSNNNYAYYIASTGNVNYIRLRFSTNPSLSNINDYVFTITISPTAMYLGAFVGNTYYNIGNDTYKGIFEGCNVELRLQSQTSGFQDISSQVLRFNTMQFVEPLISEIANNNNNNTYQYYIRFYFNSMQIGFLPQIYTRYLELSSIRANGTTYATYSSAQSSLAWLGNSMQLYNTDGTLFKTIALRDSYQFDTIDYIDFRIVDYTFKSSSYYSSTLGLTGYLKNTYFTSLESSEVVIANQTFQQGKDVGYNEGYIDGFQEGSTQNRGTFGNLMLSVADVPIHILYSILNFNILGTNLASLFMALISLLMFIWLIRRFKE